MIIQYNNIFIKMTLIMLTLIIYLEIFKDNLYLQL